MRRSLLAFLAAIASLMAMLTMSPAAHAGQFVEPYADNPVTSEPPVSRPAGAHCSVTLADHFKSNAPDGSAQDFSGTLTPPAGCSGSWSKVVMDYTVSVSGRQYDRFGHLSIGGTEVYWGTTEEPGGAKPITYTVSKDLTEYSALLRTPQPFRGGIVNYTSNIYTGVYDQTVTLTYYSGAQPKDTPDAVVGLGEHDLWPPNSVHMSLADLPRNITHATLELTLEGHGCDEQWFSNVPADLASKDGLCGGGPYREADVSLDGNPVAAVHTFPHIYTGGIVPTLWRPIPAIHTFSLYAEHVDVTPFVGTLVDGGTHDLAVNVQNAGDMWSVIPTLLIYTDHNAAQTHGAVTVDNVAPTATEQVSETPVGGGNVRVADSTSRNDVTAGWLDTSAGRVYTRVARTMSYRNDDTVSNGGWTQNLTQSDSGTQTSTSTINGSIVSGTQHSYSYPLTVDSTVGSYVDGNNYSLSGTVDMTQTLSDSVTAGHGWQPASRSTEFVKSNGVLARTNGVVTSSDGNSSSRYAGDDDAGSWYVHYLASDHGLITQNVVG